MAEESAIAVGVRGAGQEPRTGAADREPDSCRLADALARGDARTALPLLMDRYGETVYRYCRRMLGIDADGEDASQTVFIQAFAAIQRRSRIENVRSWLIGIARHRCLDRLQQRRRGPVLIDADELERALDSEGAGGGVERDPRASQALEDCLDALDARSRAVVLLRFQDQLSYRVISELTGDGTGALRVRVARALPALRRCLEIKEATP